MNVHIHDISDDTSIITLVFTGVVKKLDVQKLQKILSNTNDEHKYHITYFQNNINKQVQYTWSGNLDTVTCSVCLEFGVPHDIVTLLLHPPNVRDEKPVEIPHTFKGDLHPYQLEACQFANRKLRTMLALDMGLGKTVIGVVYALLHLPALVVCPANMIDSWITHIDAFAPDISCTSKYLDGSHDITVVSYHRLHHIKKNTTLSMNCIVADEAHFLKHESSARSSIFASFQQSIQRTLLLTGTPAQRHMDMYHLLKLMDPLRFSSFFSDQRRVKKKEFHFADRYCVPKPVWLAGKRHGFKFGENRNVEELRLVCKKYLLRMTKEEVLTLPTMYRNTVVVGTLTGEAAKNVQSQLDEIENIRDTKGSLYADCELLSMCRQTALDKVSLVCPIIYDIHCSKTDYGRCIIFFHHKDVGQGYVTWMKEHTGRMDKKGVYCTIWSIFIVCHLYRSKLTILYTYFMYRINISFMSS
jgi:SNF2 family DNA or RNA helicase